MKFSQSTHLLMSLTLETLTSKHLSWWRRLSSSSSEDVLKTSSRHLDQDGYIRPSHTSSEDVFKKSSRRLGKTFWRFLQKSARHLAKMSSRHLQDVFNTYHQVKLFLLNSFQDVFETYSNVFQTYLFLFLFILFFSPLISIIQLYNQ